MVYDTFWDYSRVLASFLVGVLLSWQGSLMQGITHNPLADASTLGISSLVVFNILLVHFIQILGWNQSANLESLALGLIFFELTLFILLRPKKTAFDLQDQRQRLLLFGLCLNLFMGAFFSLMQFIFLNLNYTFPSELWFGNFRFVPLQSIALLLFLVLGGWTWIWRKRHAFHSLSFGLDVAENFSNKLPRLVGEVFLFTFLSTAVIHCYFGVFAFLGLILPQLLRLIPSLRTNFSREILLGPWISGLFLMLLDLFCQSVTIHGAEMPVGMLSAVMGSLLLLVFLIKEKKSVRTE